LIEFVYLRQKKIGVYRTSAVRSFVCPSRRHTFSSLRHTFKFCSDGGILVQWWSNPVLSETKSTKTKRNETKSTKWKRNKTKPTKSTKTKRNTMLDYFPYMSQCLSPGEDRIWSPLNKNTPVRAKFKSVSERRKSVTTGLFRFHFVDFVSFRFVFVDFVSFSLFSFRFVSFRFVSFRFVSFRFYFVSHFIGTPEIDRQKVLICFTI
jgi:hypothetical protein